MGCALNAVNDKREIENGSTVAGTVAYNITVANAGASISWQAGNGGLFRKSTSLGTDFMYGQCTTRFGY